ncbi:bacterial Ig-like domain-containing protein, partial [Lactococcus sp. dk322]
ESENGVVKVELLSSDAAYNYYRFTAEGKNAQKNSTNVSFSIPLEFKVVSGTSVGNYPIPYLSVGSTNEIFPQIIQATNNLTEAQAINMGYDNSIASSYSGITSGHSPLTVASGTKLEGSSAGRGDAGQAWSNNSVFAVEHSGMPQMKASIMNSGNTSFTSARLYNILPEDNDNRGSSGSIEFTGLDNAAGGTVYYSTKPVSELPGYDSTNLQTWNATTLASYGFTSTKPASGITAIYIDFGNKVIAPNETLDSILNFEVPATGNQKAVNQFHYSAKEVGTGVTLNATTTPVTFSTEIVKANFLENLPTVLPSGVTQASNVPGEVATLLDESGNGSLTIPSDVPTLPGYTFKEWVNSSNSSDIKHPGDTFDVTSAVSEYTYKAVWKANSINVKYHPNDASASPTVQTKAYDFGTNVNLSDVNPPTRSGYTFTGWNTKADGTGDTFIDNTLVNFTTDKTVYAQWKANAYTITFDGNGASSGNMTDQAMTYDVAAALNANAFSKVGYTFTGWNTKADGSGTAYSDTQSVKNLIGTAKGKVTLYAQWKANAYTITFDGNGASSGNMTDQAMTYDVATALNANTFSKDGYVFEGWSTKIDGPVNYTDQQTVSNLNDEKDGKTTLYAVWREGKNTIVAHDSTLYVGDSWNKADNFTSATDELGNPVDFSAVTVTEIDPVDTTTVGEYRVNYIYKNKSTIITVKVVENQETLVTKDLTIFEGNSWTASDHFISATTKDGSAVLFDSLVLENHTLVDSSKAGIYTFKVINGKTTNLVTLTVLKDQASIKVKDTTLTVGDSWDKADNFISATDRYGNPLALDELTVTGDVDTSKVGQYKVTYSWAVKNADGSLTGDTISVDAYVTVVAKTTAPDKEKPTTSTPTSKQTRTVNASGQTKTSGTYRTLPKTGESSSFSILAIGISLLLLGGALALFGVKRRKNN